MGSGGGKSTTETTVTEPWSGQKPYLSDAFSQAQQKYYQAEAANTPGYTGEFIAGPRPEQLETFQNALNFANGSGMGYNQGGMNVSQGLASGGAAGVGQAMSGLYGMANSDPTQAQIGAAGQYADNPYMSGMIDSAMTDARRQVHEQALPQLERSAALSGNSNSSRTGISEGILNRGLAETTANVSADLRGQAYQQGLQLAQGDTAARQQALAQLGQLGQGAAQTGLGGIESGITNQQTLTDIATLASTQLQRFDQAVIDNQLAKYDYQANAPWQNLQNYYGIIGDQSWGGTSTGTSKTKNEASTMSTLGSMAAIMGSLFRCDIRVKENIQRIGRLDNGVNIYKFNYKDAPEKLVIGPIAQEVERIVPEAIVEIAGLKHVDMAVLTEAR